MLHRRFAPFLYDCESRPLYRCDFVHPPRPTLQEHSGSRSRSSRGGASSSTPAWAQRANEPMLPTVDLQGVKKDVQRDLKEIKKASDEIARLAKK